MGFFARAKERTRRIKRRAMDGPRSDGSIARKSDVGKKQMNRGEPNWELTLRDYNIPVSLLSNSSSSLVREKAEIEPVRKNGPH
jgi:hypothetical protein